MTFLTPLIFSEVRLQEIRDAVRAGAGREIEKVAQAFGPLREPFHHFMVLVPVATQDPGMFGVELEACGFRHTQHLSIETFREAGLETDGLPACGVFIAAPFAQPA